jgi:hypothetical protein
VYGIRHLQHFKRFSCWFRCCINLGTPQTMSNDIMSIGSKQTRGNALESYPEGGSLRLTLAEVPAYLQKGELFRNLKQNEDIFRTYFCTKKLFKANGQREGRLRTQFSSQQLQILGGGRVARKRVCVPFNATPCPQRTSARYRTKLPSNQTFVVTLPPQSTKAPGYSGARRRPATIEISPQAGPCLARHGMLCSSRNRTADLHMKTVAVLGVVGSADAVPAPRHFARAK